MNKPIDNRRHALISFCRLILHTEDVITEEHVCQVREIIQSRLDSGLSPKDIKNIYNLNYTDFGMFIKKCLGLRIKNIKEAAVNLVIKSGKIVTDEKKLYWSACKFSFDPYAYPDIPGYDLLLERGIYHPKGNPDGVCRDHMVSINYGWYNHIDPAIISSKYNCQFITNYDNIVKNSKSCITVQDLLNRIDQNDLKKVDKSISKMGSAPRSQEWKNKLSAANIGKRYYTNGVINIVVNPENTPPDGFRRGVTRKIQK